MVEVIGTVKKVLFESEGFAILLLNSLEFINPSNTERKSQVIKGKIGLPAIPGIRIRVTGEVDSKRKSDIVATDFEEIKPSDPNGIKKYLATLKGCGAKTAEKIYAEFGDNTFTVLDVDTDNLAKIKGISMARARSIGQSYSARGKAKELFVYLYSRNVSASKANKIFAILSKRKIEDPLDYVKNHPFKLFLDGMISFNLAAKLNYENKGPDVSDEKIGACILEALLESELSGNTYTNWHDLQRRFKALFSGMLTSDEQIDVMHRMRDSLKGPLLDLVYIDDRISDGEKIFYRKRTGMCEHNIAYKVKRLMTSFDKKLIVADEEDVKAVETALSLSLSKEQEKAVITAMKSPLTVVTGGPGTGKTTFLKVLLGVYKSKHPGGKVKLAAPTGRAARRMQESTGVDAKTIHSMLGLFADVEGESHGGGNRVYDVGADLLIVDESSMLDTSLASTLFDAVDLGQTQVVMIGDIYQLPSVGPGTVLQSLIECKKIPTVKFTKIFRQKKESTIPVNAKAINEGQNSSELQLDDSFRLVQADYSKAIVDAVAKEYKAAVDEYGIDETIVLTPYRQKTATGVNELNPVLKELINPIKEDEKFIKGGATKLYVGDKVMFTRNNGELSNGDIGYVEKICKIDNEMTAVVKFLDETTILYEDDFVALDMAYCTTIHKSQGSEADCVIIVVDNMHKNLLSRNLIYTAVTRSKKRVIIVGCVNSALDYAIQRNDTLKRDSELTDLLKNTL